MQEDAPTIRIDQSCLNTYFNAPQLDQMRREENHLIEIKDDEEFNYMKHEGTELNYMKQAAGFQGENMTLQSELLQMSKKIKKQPIKQMTLKKKFCIDSTFT